MKTVYVYSLKKNLTINSFLIDHGHEFEIKIVRSYGGLLNALLQKTSKIVLIDKPNNLEDPDYQKVIQLKQQFPPMIFIEFSEHLDETHIHQSILKLLALDEKNEVNSIHERLSYLARETNPILIQEIVGMFILKIDDYDKNLHQFLEEKKYDKITFLAHNLKSSSSNVGAINLTSYCAVLEKYNFNQPDLLHLQLYLNQIKFEYQRLSTHLKFYLAA